MSVIDKAIDAEFKVLGNKPEEINGEEDFSARMSFVLQGAGTKEMKLSDGSTGLMYFFTLHTNDEKNTLLVHELEDGTQVPLVFQTYPIQVSKNKSGPKLLVPDKKSSIIH